MSWRRVAWPWRPRSLLRDCRKAPRLYGNLAEVYREKVARLREALAAEGGPEIVEAIRSLIARVEVHPPQERARGPRIELVGHLAAMLRAAGLEGYSNAKSPLALASGHWTHPAAGLELPLADASGWQVVGYGQVALAGVVVGT